MSDNNQRNKTIVWDFWQKLNHSDPAAIPDVIRAAMHADVDWNGPAPIDHVSGVEAVIEQVWQPMLKSFPDLKRECHVFMGGTDSFGDEWVSGCGYLTGTFAQDWLGIPATGRKTHIHFGQFYVMRNGKIAENYVIYDVLAVMRQAGFQVLRPAWGMEGGKIPGPVARDGIMLTEQDPLTSQKSGRLVRVAMDGLRRYVRERDAGNMNRMEHWHYWHPDMRWLGPVGIGGSFSIEEFEDFHQRPWLHGFGDRTISVQGGRRMGSVGEGLYTSGGTWDVAFSYNHGDYLGYPATKRLITIRDFDWWRREGDLIIENWIPIDLIDIFRQMDIDLIGIMHEQIELRRSNERSGG